MSPVFVENMEVVIINQSHLGFEMTVQVFSLGFGCVAVINPCHLTHHHDQEDALVFLEILQISLCQFMLAGAAFGMENLHLIRLRKSLRAPPKPARKAHELILI
jgi:hypothetical protein